MGLAGRLARGKANFDFKKFLNNSETLEYIATLKKEAPKVKEEKKEVKVKKEKSE